MRPFYYAALYATPDCTWEPQNATFYVDASKFERWSNVDAHNRYPICYPHNGLQREFRFGMGRKSVALSMGKTICPCGIAYRIASGFLVPGCWNIPFKSAVWIRCSEKQTALNPKTSTSTSEHQTCKPQAAREGRGASRERRGACPIISLIRVKSKIMNDSWFRPIPRVAPDLQGYHNCSKSHMKLDGHCTEAIRDG